jgi:polysaccharide export outer membrane protein
MFRSLCCLLLIAFTASAQTLRRADEPPVSRYLINPGDVIEVQYRLTPEFNQTLTVQPDGYVTFTLAGVYKISELTVDQVRTLLVRKSSERLHEPEINVVLKEFQKPYFVVAGEVVNPGRLEMREKVTAWQAVLLAGGFKDSAKASQILVFRRLNQDEAEVKSLDLRRIKRPDGLRYDLPLEPGDLLLVPQNTFSKIARIVKFANLGMFFNPADLAR